MCLRPAFLPSGPDSDFGGSPLPAQPLQDKLCQGFNRELWPGHGAPARTHFDSGWVTLTPAPEIFLTAGNSPSEARVVAVLARNALWPEQKNMQTEPRQSEWRASRNTSAPYLTQGATFRVSRFWSATCHKFPPPSRSSRECGKYLADSDRVGCSTKSAACPWRAYR